MRILGEVQAFKHRLDAEPGGIAQSLYSDGVKAETGTLVGPLEASRKAELKARRRGAVKQTGLDPR